MAECLTRRIAKTITITGRMRPGPTHASGFPAPEKSQPQNQWYHNAGQVNKARTSNPGFDSLLFDWIRYADNYNGKQVEGKP